MNSKIIKELADRFNTDEEVIERVIRSQFEFVKDTIEQGEFQTVRLHHFGAFRAKPAKLAKIKDATGK